ncbi:hypothetical protein C0992_009682 [Termitomyces sp. T32_za158]|nr:hypothetical protein C0992_009682 [Termitomyces sp. T32_za158]
MVVPPSAIIRPPQRYRSLSRKILTRALRRPYRLKKKRITLKKTPAEKREANEKRRERRQSYQEARSAAWDLLEQEAMKLHERFGGHSLQWYKEDILQVGRLKGDSRGVSRWNAYLRAEAKRLNADGANPLKAHELAALLKEKWNQMSQEEKVALTDPLLKELEEHRQSISHGQRNVDLESFGDARQSLLAIERYILALYARTGTEVFVVASRTSADSYLHPFITYTSQRPLDFAFNQFKMGLGDIASRFEAFCLSGVEGMVNIQTAATAELKTRLKELINGQLESLVGKARMVYTGFEERFTIPYGVIIVNWPIDRFRSPSELTRPEVDILLGAWSTNTTYFRKMDPEEWAKWRQDRATAPSTCLTNNSSAADSADLGSDAGGIMNDSGSGASGTTNDSGSGASGTTNEQDIQDMQDEISPDSTVTPAPMTSTSTTPPIFINMTGPGTMSVGPVRKRKQRSDAGQKRGPRKKKASPLSTEASA